MLLAWSCYYSSHVLWSVFSAPFVDCLIKNTSTASIVAYYAVDIINQFFPPPKSFLQIWSWDGYCIVKGRGTWWKRLVFITMSGHVLVGTRTVEWMLSSVGPWKESFLDLSLNHSSLGVWKHDYSGNQLLWILSWVESSCYKRLSLGCVITSCFKAVFTYELFMLQTDAGGRALKLIRHVFF